MEDDHHYALGELDRRMGNVLRFGTVTEVDNATARVRVDIGGLVTDWVPWLTSSAGQDRAWRPLDVGAQVALASPGDPSQGVVVGQLWQDAHPANGNTAKDSRLTFKDGTVIEIDRDASVLNLTMAAAGTLNATISGTKIEASASHIKFTVGGVVMEITSSGIAITGGGSLTHNGKNIGATHTHGGVTTGAGTTGVPT